MAKFTSTVKTSNAATGRDMEILHWPIEAADLSSAEIIIRNRISNTNHTIPTVINTFITIEPWQRGICIWLARGNHCQGHPLDLEQLKQQRGGNETN